MSDEPRVRQLVDELLDTERTPEEVCADCPELVAEVRKRSQQMLRVVEAELEAMFPTPGPGREVDTQAPCNPAAGRIREMNELHDNFQMDILREVTRAEGGRPGIPRCEEKGDDSGRGRS